MPVLVVVPMIVMPIVFLFPDTLLLLSMVMVMIIVFFWPGRFFMLFLCGCLCLCWLTRLNAGHRDPVAEALAFRYYVQGVSASTRYA